jgi:hypothetical protein
MDEIELARQNSHVFDVEAQSYLNLLNFEVRDEDDNRLAAETLRHVKERISAVEAERKKISVPLNAALKAVNDLFRPARQKLEECERQLKSKIAAYLSARDAANRVALAAAAAAPTPELAGDALAAIERAAPPEGVSVRTVWRFKIVDENLVPREYCSPDPKKIAAAEIGTVPGVEFYQEPIVASRRI